MNDQQTIIPPTPRQLFMQWYHSTASGKTLRDSESHYLLNSLQLTYSQRIIQVDRLGIESNYITEEFNRNFIIVQTNNEESNHSGNLILSKIEDWPIACESVDTLILPHVIEFEVDPRQVLNEAERVLKPEGRLYVLGFNPWNPQVLLRHRQSSPASWSNHFVGSHQLMEWLSLLKFEPEVSAGFGFSFPKAVYMEPLTGWRKSMANLTPVYAIKAIKRTRMPIALKPAWLNAPGLLPGQAMVPPLMRSEQ